MSKIPEFTLQAQYTLEDLNKRLENSMGAHLGIEYIEIGEDFLKAKMPVDHRTHQPLGMLNGGASLALAEITGSMAANLYIDRTKFVALGLEINANHLKSVRDGFVYAIARPFHMGRTTQVWEIKIEDESENLICVSRLTMAVVELK